MTFLFDWFVRPLLALMAPVMLVLAVSGCVDPCADPEWRRASFCQSKG